VARGWMVVAIRIAIVARTRDVSLKHRYGTRGGRPGVTRPPSSVQHGRSGSLTCRLESSLFRNRGTYKDKGL